MYLSFYITDAKSVLIFQYLPSVNAPTFQNLWIKIKSLYPNYTSDSHTTINVGKNLEAFRYFSATNNLNYWCLKSEERKDDVQAGKLSIIDPYVFMEKMDELLMAYFDKDILTIKKLINNYDRLTMIFNYVLDDGEPQVGDAMYSNRIKNAIPLQNDLTKFINSTAKSFSGVVTKHELGSGYNQKRLTKGINDHGLIDMDAEVVPWRSNKITEYTKEEIYFDITERIHLVIQKHNKHSNKNIGQNNGYGSNISNSRMKIVHGYIHGSIESRCSLNESPTVELNINNNANDLGLPRFHDCVKVEDYIIDNEGKGLLNSKIKFIPPDGKFKLLEYNIDMNDFSCNNIGLVSVNFENNLGNKGDEFEITININDSIKVEKVINLCVNLEFSKDVRSLQKNENNINVDGVEDEDDTAEEEYYKIKILRNTHGRFSNDVDPKRGNWIFDSLTLTGTLAVLRGCIETTKSNNRTETDISANVPKDQASKLPNPHVILQRINIKYEHEGQIVSGMKVNSIEISNTTHFTDTKNIFKGVKYLSKMEECEIRER